jgi:hypothetical protein
MAQLLDAASSVEMPPDLERMISLSNSPILTNDIAITPLDNDPAEARVSTGIGPIDLQCTVSLLLLFEALEDLKANAQAAGACPPVLDGRLMGQHAPHPHLTLTLTLALPLQQRPGMLGHPTR